MRKQLSFLFALSLGMLCVLPFFVVRIPGLSSLPSREAGWILYVTEAAALCAIYCFTGKITLAKVIVFCIPVTAVSLLLGIGAGIEGVKLAAEPILCVWIGALLVWLVPKAFRGMLSS